MVNVVRIYIEKWEKIYAQENKQGISRLYAGEKVKTGKIYMG